LPLDGIDHFGTKGEALPSAATLAVGDQAEPAASRTTRLVCKYLRII
jgi:hypothetical protein